MKRVRTYRAFTQFFRKIEDDELRNLFKELTIKYFEDQFAVESVHTKRR